MFLYHGLVHEAGGAGPAISRGPVERVVYREVVKLLRGGVELRPEEDVGGGLRGGVRGEGGLRRRLGRDMERVSVRHITN